MENTINNNKFFVTGLFKDRDSAECAYSAIDNKGYGKDDLEVIMSEDTRNRYYPDDTAEESEVGSKALEGTGAGAAIGGTVGAIIGAIAAIGTSVVLPGLGLIVAGPLAAALVGAGAGGITGGLVGALIGAGIPEEHAEAYETGIKSGNIFLRANTRTADDANAVKDKWESCGGVQVYTNAAEGSEENAYQKTNAKPGEIVIPVIEEDVKVGKRTVPTGGVKVHVENDLKGNPIEKTVNLREEDVNVERRQVDRPVNQADMDAIKNKDFVVTESAEKPVVAKEARVVEEVVISKDVKENDKTINENVRRTDVDVDNLADNQENKRYNTAS